MEASNGDPRIDKIPENAGLVFIKSVFLRSKHSLKERRNNMAIYAVNINERTNAGKSLLGYLQSLGVIEGKVKKTADGYEKTLQAVKKAEEGELIHYDSFNDFKARMYEL